LLAVSEADAIRAAGEVGYPVVLKLHSRTITHKSDVGGVRLNLATEDAVRAAYHSIRESLLKHAGKGHFEGVTVQPMVLRRGYEAILGSSTDPQFGPVLLFGTGGQLVEVFRDRSLALPPLNTTLARRLIERTKIFQAFVGIRGQKPVDLAALEELIVRFSQLVVEQRWVKEIEINPLLVSAEGLVVLDARVLLHVPEIAEVDLPRTAIQPYPSRYAHSWTIKDATPVTIRPIRPEDEPMMVHFHSTLSDRSVYLRYFHMFKLGARVAHERLARVCFIDYDREMVLIAERKDATGNPEIIGVGRLTNLHGSDAAEFAIVVSDQYQRHGLGRHLLERLVEIGRDEHISRITGDILPENLAMLETCRRLGFRVKYDAADGIHRAEIEFS